MTRMSPALTRRRRMTPTLVALDSALSRFGWIRTVSAMWAQYPDFEAVAPTIRGWRTPLLVLEAERLSTSAYTQSVRRAWRNLGRRARFRSSWSQGRGGSSPSARTSDGPHPAQRRGPRDLGARERRCRGAHVQ